MKRLSNALQIAWWAWKNPDTLNRSNFKMLSDLLVLILKVSNSGRHFMSHIAYIHPDEGEKQIVSIWAGAGAGASPTERISELIEENEKLKRMLSKQIDLKNKI